MEVHTDRSKRESSEIGREGDDARTLVGEAGKWRDLAALAGVEEENWDEEGRYVDDEDDGR